MIKQRRFIVLSKVYLIISLWFSLGQLKNVVFDECYFLNFFNLFLECNFDLKIIVTFKQSRNEYSHFERLNPFSNTLWKDNCNVDRSLSSNDAFVFNLTISIIRSLNLGYMKYLIKLSALIQFRNLQTTYSSTCNV